MRPRVHQSPTNPRFWRWTCPCGTGVAGFCDRLEATNAARLHVMLKHLHWVAVAS